MGLQFRRRTKGKNSWLNFSGSSRGLNASYSIKIGSLTFNIGKHGNRSTLNLGNGFKYVSYKRRKNEKTPQPSKVYESYEKNLPTKTETPWHELSPEEQRKRILDYCSTRACVKKSEKSSSYGGWILFLIILFLVIILV